MGTVALYCRISKDRAGRMESVGDQEIRGRAYATERWPGAPVEVWVDNAITAADSDVHRPGYTALREAIRAGAITHVWAIEQSRLERTEVGWFQLAAELVAAGIDEVHTHRDGIVRLDEVAGIKAVLNAAEVRKIRARTRDKKQRLAAQGRPDGGGRDFGYQPGRNQAGEATLEVVDEEAAHIRWAAESILAGWSLSSVARELNARGARLPRGGKSWGTTQVRRIVTKPSVAGLRVHHGKVVGRATWEPILDEATWRQVRAELDTRATARSADGTTHTVVHTRRAARRYLLSGGLARCGLCKHPLVGAARAWAARPDQPPYYLCPPGRGCARIGVVAAPVDLLVHDVLLDALDQRAAFHDPLAADTTAEERDRIGRALADAEARQVELARRWAAGDLPAAAWDAARAGLEDLQARLSADLAALPAPAGRVDPAELREAWGLMTLEERRHVVRLYVAAVWVDPARPGNRFDPGRVRVEWR